MPQPNCLYCGKPLTIASATALICPACGMVEFCDRGTTQQLHLQFEPQQQQRQPEVKKK